MLTLLRNRQLKPDKGRRKDLKKIESVVNDLTMLIENW
jgi:t-SNARE complex subunit (syntaxin)